MFKIWKSVFKVQKKLIIYFTLNLTGFKNPLGLKETIILFLGIANKLLKLKIRNSIFVICN